MAVKTEDFLSDEFLKQFKSGEQLNESLSSIQKRAIEKMLEGELDDHLGYEKHRQGQSDNNRNGYGKKNIKTSYGEMEIQVPHDRNASSKPMLVPKRENMLDGRIGRNNGVDARQRLSASDIQEHAKDIYNFDVSSSIVKPHYITYRRRYCILAEPFLEEYLSHRLDGMALFTR
ncbi:MULTISPECIES: transposase [Chitinophagaceae]